MWDNWEIYGKNVYKYMSLCFNKCVERILILRILKGRRDLGKFCSYYEVWIRFIRKYRIWIGREKEMVSERNSVGGYLRSGKM